MPSGLLHGADRLSDLRRGPRLCGVGSNLEGTWPLMTRRSRRLGVSHVGGTWPIASKNGGHPKCASRGEPPEAEGRSGNP